MFHPVFCMCAWNTVSQAGRFKRKEMVKLVSLSFHTVWSKNMTLKYILHNKKVKYFWQNHLQKSNIVKIFASLCSLHLDLVPNL